MIVASVTGGKLEAGTSVQGQPALLKWISSGPPTAFALTFAVCIAARSVQMGPPFASVLQVPAPFTVGNAPRSLGTCRQPGQNNATLSAFKEFMLPMIREGAKLQFRFEAFNALNHPQFNGPNTTFNSGNFGVITSTANSPREVQLALKLYF